MNILNKLDEWLYLVGRFFSHLFCKHRRVSHDGISIHCVNCGEDLT